MRLSKMLQQEVEGGGGSQPVSCTSVTLRREILRLSMSVFRSLTL